MYSPSGACGGPPCASRAHAGRSTRLTKPVRRFQHLRVQSKGLVGVLCNCTGSMEHQGLKTEQNCRVLFKHFWLRSCYCMTTLLFSLIATIMIMSTIIVLSVIASAFVSGVATLHKRKIPNYNGTTHSPFTHPPLPHPGTLRPSLRAPAFFASAPRALPGAAARRFLHQGQIGRGADARGFQARYLFCSHTRICIYVRMYK